MALLADLGIKPERTVVSLNAAKEVVLEHMPDKAHSMTRESYWRAGVVTANKGRKALKAILRNGQIQGTGRGGRGSRSLLRSLKGFGGGRNAGPRGAKRLGPQRFRKVEVEGIRQTLSPLRE